MEKFEAKGSRGKMDVKKNAAFVELGGEELMYINSRILCREASERRSSSVYYRRSAEGVPFKWEKKPGTPNTKDYPNNNNNNNDVIPPLSPPPSLQNLGLPLPCFDHETEQQSKNVLLSWKKKIKKMLHAAKIIGKKSGGGGDLPEVEHKSSETTHHQGKKIGVEDSDIASSSFNNSNFSSSSSSSSSSSGSNNGPFCYSSPWNIMLSIAAKRSIRL